MVISNDPSITFSNNKDNMDMMEMLEKIIGGRGYYEF
jgi:hypothetical protein